MFKTLFALAAALALLGCGGGGGGGGSSTSTTTSTTTTTPPTTTTLSNFVAVSLDAGPTGVTQGPNGYTETNVAYASITLCAPGSTTNCQTIDHIQVDTGSVGLRVFASVINPTLLSALPLETDTSNNPVAECYQYVDGYVFGSVRSADMTIGGETVAGMPFHALADGGQFATVPSSCSAGGGSEIATVNSFGANGIIGIGTTTTDCGTTCASGGQTAAIYYDCPTSGCASVIARASSASAPFQQLPNPVAAMATDNNGTVLVLPAVGTQGAITLSGTLYFGIGTETNNALGSATIYTVTTSAAANGPGLLDAVYNGQTLRNSFLDSGSSDYFFVDNTLQLCQGSAFYGFYCPSSTVTLSPVIRGLNGASFTDTFQLYNAISFFNTNPNDSAAPGIGGNTNLLFPSGAFQSSFDFGMPFFFGRSVYTAIEGRSAGGRSAPMWRSDDHGLGKPAAVRPFVWRAKPHRLWSRKIETEGVGPPAGDPETVKGVERAPRMDPRSRRCSGLVLAAVFLGCTSAVTARAQVIEVGAGGDVSRFSGPVQTLDGTRRPISPPALQPPPHRSSGPSAEVAEALQTSADANQLSVRLMEAVAWQESRFRQGAISHKGARGVMQLMPDTARSLGIDAQDLGANVRGGAVYMARLLKAFDGDVILALAAYNAGPEAVRRFGGVPPYAETRAFVAAVLDRLSDAAKAPAGPALR